MAYVAQQLPDNEQNQFGLKSPTTPNPIPPQIGGSSGSQAGGAPPGVGTSTQFGSNAAKLSDYLTANADQIPAYGQQVSDKLNQNYSDTMGNVNSFFGDFGNQVTQGYQAPDQTKVSQAAADPAAFASNPDNVKQFQGWYTGDYTGPKNVESTQPYTDINDKVNQAVSNANLTKTPSGLGSFLNNFMGANDTTPGMQTLDTALLTGNPGAYSSIKNAAKPYEGLTNYLGQKTQSANQTAAGAAQNAQDSKAALQNKFSGTGGVIPSLQSDLSSRLANTKTDQSSAAQKAMFDFKGGAATPEELKMLGFNSSDLNDQALANSWKNAQALHDDYGVDQNWNALFTNQNPDAVYTSPGTVATPAEIEKAQALEKLTGNKLTDWLGNTTPSGSLVTPDRQGLGDMGTNLGQRDQDLFMQNWRSFYPGGTDTQPTYQQIVQQIQQAGIPSSEVYNNAVKTGNKALIDAVSRMGYGPGAPSGGPGGIIHAS